MDTDNPRLYSLASSVLANVTTSQAYERITNDTTGMLQAYYCSLNDTSSICAGICPNTDIAGVGVRAAIYFQSLLTVLVALYGRNDAFTTSQCAIVVLTLAHVVPATIDKYRGDLSLYHATLVLNFCTLSTLASLAITPWYITLRDNVGPKHARTMKNDRGGIVLLLALTVQVVAQWVWAAIVFWTPSEQWYESICHMDVTGVPSGFFKGLLEMLPYWSNGSVDGLADQAIWVPPLLFHILLTGMYFTAYITFRPSILQRLDHLWSWYGISLVLRSAFAIAVIFLFIVRTELQHALNPWLLPGENNATGFGQLAALLLATAPMWNLIGTAYDRKFKSTKRPPAPSPPAPSPNRFSSSVLSSGPEQRSAAGQSLEKKPSRGS